MKLLKFFGPRRWLGVAFVVVLGPLAATPAVAQEPPARKPPVEAPDTLRPPADSVAADSAAQAPADTLRPVVAVASFPRLERPRWTAGVWEWDRAGLLASGAATLTELLEQVPGFTPVRSGFFGFPETASLPGATAGRFEVLLDGFALDPLGAGSYDLSRLELVHLERVRVERRGGGIRVDLETLAPTDSRPYSRVEAGTGDLLNTQLFRGVFLAPRALVGPLSLGIERLSSDGLLRQEPANAFAGWAKWGLVWGKVGIEVETRRSQIERRPRGGSPFEGARQDWVVRARSEPVDGLSAEAFFGVSGVEDVLGDTIRTEEEGKQGGVRAAYRWEGGWVRSVVRGRDHRGLPGAEAELAAGLELPAGLVVSGDVSHANWREGTRATAYSARAEIGPFLGLRPFAEYSGGRRGVPNLRAADGAPVLTERTSMRFGAELARGGLRLGGAGVLLEADSLADYGLPFDRTARLFPGGRVQGLELTGRVPLLRSPLALEGWYTRWAGDRPWIYLPTESWRAALVYHDHPLTSRNFEVLARLEGHGRSGMAVPAADAATVAVPPLTALDFYLQIRVVSLRAFLRWENIAHRLDLQDLPGRIHPGQRLMYGVKWEFWN